MKVAVYKVNTKNRKEKYIGIYDEKSIKTRLRGYKELEKGSGIYKCKNSNWIFYIQEFNFN